MAIKSSASDNSIGRFKACLAVVATVFPALYVDRIAGASEAVGELQEVVVTATKRSVSMQDVSISAQAIPEARLETAGVQDLVGLSQISSAVGVVDVGFVLPFIRGVGSSVSGSGIYSSVSSYVDGIYVPRTASLNTGAGDLGDAESVVILKGPQGSLYGRNATGGALVITTHTPRAGDPASGSVQLSYGNYSDRQVKARFASGINDVSAFSVSVAYHKNDGFITDLTDGSGVDDTNQIGVATKLALEPSDNISVVLAAKFNRSNTRYAQFQQFAQAYPGAIPGLNAPQTLYAGTLISFGISAADAISAASGLMFARGIGHGSYDNERSGFDNGVIDGKCRPKSCIFNKDMQFSATARVKFEPFDFVSISAYNENVFHGAADVLNADPTSVPTFGLGAPSVGFTQAANAYTFSQELQLVSNGSAIQWIAGANYFRDGGPVVGGGDAFGFSSIIAGNHWRVNSIAAFGEATIPMGRFAITAGGRYTREKYDLRDEIDTAATGIPNVGNLSRTDKQFTPSLRLDFRPTDRVLTYVSATTGFKSGSLNPTDPAAGSAGPEKIKALELGVKSELADHHIRLNAATFFYDYTNIQLNVLVPGSATFLVNGSKSHVYGAEAELAWVVNEKFTLNLDATALNTEYRSDAVFTPTAGVTGVLAIKGKDMVLAPTFAANASFDWELASLSAGTVKFSPGVRYNSGYWLNAANTYGSGGASDKSFSTVTAAVTFTSRDDHWTAALWTENAFDERYVRAGIDAAAGLTQVGVPGRPRQYGARATYRF